ncbi:peptidase inhibitor family I36 protein [Streptomyces sp. NPDC001889]
MKVKRESAAVFSALAIAGAGLLATAAPAVAAPATTASVTATAQNCASSRLCLYTGVDFTGSVQVIAGTNFCAAPAASGSTRSIVNNLSVPVRIHSLGAPVRTLPPGASDNDITIGAGGRMCAGSATP